MNDRVMLQSLFALEGLGADGAEVGRLAGVHPLVDLEFEYLVRVIRYHFQFLDHVSSSILSH